jgi:hypothetical protein
MSDSLSYFVVSLNLLLLIACGQTASVPAKQMATSPSNQQQSSPAATPPTSQAASPKPSMAPADDPSYYDPMGPEPPKKQPQLPKLLDDAKPGSDFYRFRERLRQAIRRRDANFIRQHSSPNIRLSFGDEKATWDKYKIDNPNAQIWQELARTFNSGCYRSEGQIVVWDCPYIAEFLGQHEFDTDYVGIISDQIPFYAKPNDKGSRITRLSSQIVKLDQNSRSLIFGDSTRWVGIILTNGKHGYVTSQYVYSHIGYRASIGGSGNNWGIGVFIAGD